jgi:hypothetical protein
VAPGRTTWRGLHVLREHGISRRSFYELRKRAQADGLAAVLEPGTRRPGTSPSRLTEEVKQQVIGVPEALEASGLDHGPISVHDKMRAMGPEPNACWQLDATEYVLTRARTEPVPCPDASHSHPASARAQGVIASLVLPSGWSLTSRKTTRTLVGFVMIRGISTAHRPWSSTETVRVNPSAVT